eukprot:NODE_1170_length_2089_cov_77.036623_g986_i0.p1 GENE.NODE_1170_length_2089_cov_77.036623_g986_i0~~NODE_1170_length_2089_cov_77.036623_g986_i0.p1  ORF type:complete len:662 (+),score=71.94 NODE_1170_length_2089_cov_77.036623_g986_i0:54-2039(+)
MRCTQRYIGIGCLFLILAVLIGLSQNKSNNHTSVLWAECPSGTIYDKEVELRYVNSLIDDYVICSDTSVVKAKLLTCDNNNNCSTCQGKCPSQTCYAVFQIIEHLIENMNLKDLPMVELEKLSADNSTESKCLLNNIKRNFPDIDVHNLSSAIYILMNSGKCYGQRSFSEFIQQLEPEKRIGFQNNITPQTHALGLSTEVVRAIGSVDGWKSQFVAKCPNQVLKGQEVVANFVNIPTNDDVRCSEKSFVKATIITCGDLGCSNCRAKCPGQTCNEIVQYLNPVLGKSVLLDISEEELGKLISERNDLISIPCLIFNIHRNFMGFDKSLERNIDIFKSYVYNLFSKKGQCIPLLYESMDPKLKWDVSLTLGLAEPGLNHLLSDALGSNLVVSSVNNFGTAGIIDDSSRLGKILACGQKGICEEFPLLNNESTCSSFVKYVKRSIPKLGTSNSLDNFIQYLKGSQSNDIYSLSCLLVNSYVNLLNGKDKYDDKHTLTEVLYILHSTGQCTRNDLTTNEKDILKTIGVDITKIQVVTTGPIEVYLLLDVSGSMDPIILYVKSEVKRLYPTAKINYIPDCGFYTASGMFIGLQKTIDIAPPGSQIFIVADFQDGVDCNAVSSNLMNRAIEKNLQIYLRSYEMTPRNCLLEMAVKTKGSSFVSRQK